MHQDSLKSASKVSEYFDKVKRAQLTLKFLFLSCFFSTSFLLSLFPMCILDIWGQLVLHQASAQRSPLGHMGVQPLIALLKGMGHTSPQLTAETAGNS